MSKQKAVKIAICVLLVALAIWVGPKFGFFTGDGGGDKTFTSNKTVEKPVANELKLSVGYFSTTKVQEYIEFLENMETLNYKLIGVSAQKKIYSVFYQWVEFPPEHQLREWNVTVFETKDVRTFRAYLDGLDKNKFEILGTSHYFSVNNNTYVVTVRKLS